MIERIVVAGGGTGGHLFPGIAVVEELRRRASELDVLFVGTERGIEARVLPEQGERLELLAVRPLMGQSAGQLLRSVSLLPRAVAAATRILRRYRPDLVLGVGGYASGPALAAAATLGIPTALLEQNAHVGLTNRLLSHVVGRAYVTFPETAVRFGDRVRVTGNPVRRELVRAAQMAVADPDGFESRADTLLVLGGSQGARSLNLGVPEALARLDADERGKIRIVHQSGSAMRDEVAARYRELSLEAEVVPFIKDMAAAYASACLVVARAGATTVAELCAVGRPSILVPYPHAAADHQRRNAEALARAGAAECIVDHELSPEALGAAIGTLLGDRVRCRAMAEAARDHGRPDAAACIVDDLCQWLGCREVDRRASDADVGDGGAAEDLEAGSGCGSRGLRGSRPYMPRAHAYRRSPSLRAGAPRRRLVAHPSLLE